VATARARRRAGYTHDVEIDGHSLIADEPVDAGGADQGPSPTRLLAVALASCTAITMEMYADRKGWELGDLEVAVEMEYVGETSVPRSFLMTLKLPRALSDQQRDRLRMIASLCPVHKVLARDVEVEVSDRVELV
jgi:putative redox protein